MHADKTTEPLDSEKHTRWSALLISQVLVLVLVNAMADSVVKGPVLVLDEMLDHFNTDKAAWLNSSALLAGAVWAPLLGKCADLFGKRRMLMITLLVGGAGALVCLIAPNVWVFVLGRVMQGAAVGCIFLSIALVRDICTPRLAMPIVGILATGSGVLGIGTPFLYGVLTDQFGFRVVFVASAMLAVVATICVRALIPKSMSTATGRIDIAGALLLGGGLAAVLSYTSLGPDFGWFSVGPLAVLAAGAAALARWFLVSSRKPEPVIDIRNLSRPMVLTLLVVVLAVGTTEAMDHLNGLLLGVSPDQQLGYGLKAPGAEGLLFGIPGIGAVVAGPLSGVLAVRIGPAVTLAGGVVVGMVGTLGMFAGASNLYVAIFFSFLLSVSLGTLATSGFNMAGSLAPDKQQGVVSSMVMVMSAAGAVTLSFAGTAVLNSTDVVVNGGTENSALGVFSYIGMSAGAFMIATVLALLLVRRQRSTPVAAD